MSTLKKLVIMGGSGGGQIAASVVEDINRLKPMWELVGFLNDAVEVGGKMGRYPVIGRTEEAPEYVRKGYYLHYALHNAKYGPLRIKRFRKMNIPLEALPSLIHPTAHISMAESIGHGVLMAPYVNLSFGAKIGNCCHLYGSSFIGHDSTVLDFCSVANNAAVGGGVVIGEGCHIGTNCSIRERVKIGKHAIIGMGAVVLKDVGDGEIAVGNPARIIGTVDRYHNG